ncbi:MAG: substrate-binding domain-containing protein [Ruminococcus sp.]
MARHLLDLGHRDVAFITPPLTRRQWQRSKRVDGFVREFEKAGLSGHVIIRAADESADRRNPKTDSEYSMGYAPDQVSSGGWQQIYCHCRTE